MSFYCKSKEKVERDVDEIADFLSKWSWISEHSNVEFFSANKCECIPKDWISSLLSSTVQELQFMAKGLINEEWPDSLKNFIKDCQRLSLNRNPCIGMEERVKERKFNSFLTRNMNVKKQHEVLRMGTLVNGLKEKMGCEWMVDIGAGEGYISHFLCKEYSLNIVAIESNAFIASKGEKRVKMIDGLIESKSNVPSSEEKCVKFLNFSLSHDNYPFLQSKLNELMNSSGKEKEIKFGSIGLHTCGNLALMNIDAFLHSEANCLINIGCCYHSKIDEKGMTGLKDQVPAVSDYLKRSSLKLHSNSMKTATQAPQQYVNLSAEDNMVTGRNLAFRAVLESTLQKNLKTGTFRVKKIKDEYFSDFSSYLEQVEKNFCVRDESGRKWIKDEGKLKGLIVDMKKSYEENEPKFKLLTAFLAFQMTISSVYETLILLDRYLYLKQHEGAEVALFPLFDSSISPRNVALVSTKGKTKTELKETIYSLL
eukprot:TRINITY_DN5038_c0_g1_i1.p1 TRINITY_DN5038_c0_g1~~TRINITY_DN5038_c0_g1_i1.p1  ORF type:complete len:481 (+),score=176.75 TRINITY_DN5038_c0_g1_i1:51-1493(+)